MAVAIVDQSDLRKANYQLLLVSIFRKCFLLLLLLLLLFA